ncbi:imidazole glycerol phosphate synthase subunit HisH [Heliophilum fasciatum]|uniref:Imidazole glycerol phosphate synthase subunit HisH n=1 Tax=Heliophilum fasciatum TaxID=35700 RepID=A0A4R2RMI1_9FIRM|nr:imidazole glycerol phosphate synthase subunit HisH [Heliophilum fasciatum]MCW2278017.1 glutamine amidotransferase [Heliophilum fasciatum]TCP64363.1 glutamine amidotransferase [Heliophilum fasciatum]
MIAIIDYGMGNLRSVQKGLEKAGYASVITADPEQVRQAPGVILPGVGAFADAMNNLRTSGMIEPIQEVVAAGKPFLGICLGFQLMFEASEEGGNFQGLGIFPGQVRRLPPGLKVPHMGWNALTIRQANPFMDGISDGAEFYFVHSYYVDPADPGLIIATADYGLHFCAIAGREHVFGAQFHPEKSSDLGLKILENFGKQVHAC